MEDGKDLIFPSKLTVKIGALEIYHDGNQGKFITGAGARILLDGKPLPGVCRLVLTIDVHEAINAEVHFHVPAGVAMNNANG